MLTEIFQASIISQTGGTCVCQNKSDPTCATDVDYAQCVLGMPRRSSVVNRLTILGVQRDLITATAAISGLASFMFGFLTNLPVALAYVLSLSSRCPC